MRGFREAVVKPVGLVDAARARFKVAQGEFHLEAGEIERLMD